jgi:hypothetical protein
MGASGGRRSRICTFNPSNGDGDLTMRLSLLFLVFAIAVGTGCTSLKPYRVAKPSAGVIEPAPMFLNSKESWPHPFEQPSPVR